MGTDRKKHLKEGVTTGACAAAAAAAAVEAAFGPAPERAVIQRPDGKGILSIPVAEVVKETAAGEDIRVSAVVVKDAGDDPDVTHGASITARVLLTKDGAGPIVIEGGRGVGKVTRPGLPIVAGEAAINPVPRKMIEEEVLRRLPEASGYSARIVISVAEGERLAKKTLNPRLGIVGGISILGTSGVVKPFSAKSYRDTIDICLNSARAEGCSTCVLSTGRRSERLAQALFPKLSERCFVQIADFFSHSLKKAVALDFSHVVLAGFFGKLCKWAMNMDYTHARSGPTNFGFLSCLAADAGLSDGFCRFVAGANNGRHIFESEDPQLAAFVDAVAVKALGNVVEKTGGKTAITICLWDFNEGFYGKWEHEASSH